LLRLRALTTPPHRLSLQFPSCPRYALVTICSRYDSLVTPRYHQALVTTELSLRLGLVTRISRCDFLSLRFVLVTLVRAGWAVFGWLAGWLAGHIQSVQSVESVQSRGAGHIQSVSSVSSAESVQSRSPIHESLWQLVLVTFPALSPFR